MEELTAITPLDGRYRSKVKDLANFLSEYALIKTRFEIEAKYLVALSEVEVIRKLTSEEKDLLMSFADNLTIEQIKLVKELEQKTRHDVKAMEQAFRQLLGETSLADLLEMIHFGLTSSDINNISFNLMLKRAGENAIIPKIQQIIKTLSKMADENKDVPMLARTHGQAAVPTTLGKELAVFAARLNKQLNILTEQKLTGKINGAVGNYNALLLTYPEIDWIKFSDDFVNSLGLEPNLFTTQINNYDDLTQYVQVFDRVNIILISFCQDVWRYVSDGWFVQENIKGEVGSSTMPQKVNPIDFENAEGNLGLANAIFEFMARKLPVSRLQRDLSDTTVIRNIGTSLGYCVVAYESISTGLARIKPNLEQIEQDLNADWSILTEAVQTILRKENIKDAYTLVKDLARGKKIDSEEWKKWINSLPVEEKVKSKLAKLTPSNYIGLAKQLTEKAVNETAKD